MGEHHPSDSGPCLTLEKLAMKKSLSALAVLAASGTSFAQSSVTVWGIVDAAVSRGNGDVNSVTRLVGSGISSSQLGFRGTEDLGGGMSASVWLEAGLGNDAGTGGATTTNNQIFNIWSRVSKRARIGKYAHNRA